VLTQVPKSQLQQPVTDLCKSCKLLMAYSKLLLFQRI